MAPDPNFKRRPVEMDRAEAWRRLARLGGSLTAGLLIYLAGRWVAMALWTDLDQRIDLPDHIRLTPSQTAVLAAGLTATVGLLGTWAVKSRELRNARADQVAHATLDYYRTSWSLFQLIKRTDPVLEEREASLVELTKRLEEFQAKGGSGLLITAASQPQQERLKAEWKAIKRQLKAISEPVWNKETIRDAYDEEALAFTRLVMYGDVQVQSYARDLSRAVTRFDEDSKNEGARRAAGHAHAAFLLDCRTAVHAMRGSWLRRLANLARWVAIEYWKETKSALHVLRTSKRTVAGDREPEQAAEIPGQPGTDSYAE